MQTEFRMRCQGTKTTARSCVNKGGFNVPVYFCTQVAAWALAAWALTLLFIPKRSASAGEGGWRMQLKMKYHCSRKIRSQNSIATRRRKHTNNQLNY